MKTMNYFKLSEIIKYFYRAPVVGVYNPSIYNNPLDIELKSAESSNICGWLANYLYYNVEEMANITDFTPYITKYKPMLDSTEVNKLLCEYIAPSCWHLNIVRSESENNRENQDIVNLVNDVTSFFMETTPYYTQIIDYYTSYEPKLMDQVKSNTENQFNDMPMTVTDIGVENHLTTLSKGTVASDMLTPAQRLAEIRDLLDNTYKRRSDEFKEKFILF